MASQMLFTKTMVYYAVHESGAGLELCLYRFLIPQDKLSDIQADDGFLVGMFHLLHEFYIIFIVSR